MDALQEQNGRVSVWLGHFDSETEWEAYLAEQYEDELQPMNAFAADFGLGFYYDHDMQEACFNSHDLPVAELLEDNSYAKSFLNAVVEAAREAEIATANVSLLLYNGVYQPAAPEAGDDSSHRNRLRFVGVFPYIMP